MRQLCMIALLLFSTRISAASFFSAGQPTGQEYRPVLGASRGMAGVSAAMDDPYDLSLVNPANLARIREGTISFLFTQEFVQVRDDNASSWMSSSEIPMLVLAVPVEDFATLTAAYRQSSRAAFEISSGIEPIAGSDSVTQTQRGSGARYAGYVALSRAWTRWLQTGLAYERLAGSIKTTLAADFSASDAWDRFDTTSIVPSGNRLGLGATLIKGDARFAASVYVPLGTSAEEKVTQTVISPDRRVILNSPRSRDITEELPATYTAGVSYGLRGLRAGMDVSLTPWQTYERTNFDDTLETDTYLGVGIRRDLPEIQLETAWYKVLPWRAGVFYHQWPTPDLNEYGLGLGIGLPLSGKAGIFDISLELARRGSVENLSLAENSVRLSLNLTGNTRAVSSRNR